MQRMFDMRRIECEDVTTNNRRPGVPCHVANHVECSDCGQRKRNQDGEVLQKNQVRQVGAYRLCPKPDKKYLRIGERVIVERCPFGELDQICAKELRTLQVTSHGVPAVPKILQIVLGRAKECGIEVRHYV